jgi:glycosyltransferase 2 family protein
MFKNILKYGLPLVAAGLLMWFTLRGIDVAAMIDKFANANYGWILLSGLLTIVAHWSRAVRWKMLLEPMGYRPSTLNTTLAVFTGYFANYMLPRMGEVTRCGSILKTDGVPIDKSLGTVVAERVFDVISLLVLIGLNLFLEFDRLSQFFRDSFLSSKGEPRNPLILWILGLIVLGGAAFLGLFLANKNFREKVLSIGIAKKIYDFVLGLLDGLLSIRKLKSPALFIFHTILIWTMYYFMAYVLFFAIPETSNLGLLAGLTVLVVGALGMTAPTQGGIGPYHFLVGNALVLYGLTQNDGIILATFIHGSQMLAILVLGGLAFLGMLFIEKKKA